jgi:hypothetical protein
MHPEASIRGIDNKNKGEGRIILANVFEERIRNRVITCQ